MKHFLVGLAMSCVSLAGLAADKATSVHVVNPVLPVEISNVDPILTRNVDDYGREIFRYHTEVMMGTDEVVDFQKLLTTVPAGKRLVIENISWKSQGVTGSQLTGGSLGAVQFSSTRVYLQINPPHPLYLNQLQGQDGVQSGPVYFDSDEAVWLRVSKNNFGGVIFNVAINGYFVNL